MKLHSPPSLLGSSQLEFDLALRPPSAQSSLNGSDLFAKGLNNFFNVRVGVVVVRLIGELTDHSNGSNRVDGPTLRKFDEFGPLVPRGRTVPICPADGACFHFSALFPQIAQQCVEIKLVNDRHKKVKVPVSMRRLFSNKSGTDPFPELGEAQRHRTRRGTLGIAELCRAQIGQRDAALGRVSAPPRAAYARIPITLRVEASACARNFFHDDSRRTITSLFKLRRLARESRA